MTQPPPLTVKDVMIRSAQWLAERGGPSPRLDAEVLLGHVLHMTRLQLYMAWDRPLDEREKTAYRELLRRRAAAEPVAYITGRREFFALEFRVTPDVLVPRPETELLVERALEIARSLEGAPCIRVADVGVGSGAIAVALAHAHPAIRVDAIDISPPALQVARENARRHGVEDRLRFVLADCFDPAEADPFDLVVSNPPYIPEADRHALAPDVRDFEPPLALFAGADGLDAIRKIIPLAAPRLRPGGWIVLEIGHRQADAVRRILEQDGRYETPDVRRDYQGIERIVSAPRRAQ